MEHASDLFDVETIERLLAQLERLLHGALARPDARLFAGAPVGRGTPSPRRRVQRAVGGVRAARDADDLFEAQVERTPDAPAMTFEGATLGYRELDERANRVARALLRVGIGEEGLVGLAVERSLDTVVGSSGS